MKPLSSAELASWQAFVNGASALFTRLEADLAPHGITFTDYGILVELSEAPDGRLRMCDLAEAVGISPSRLTYRAKRLASLGLIDREPCPEDKRVSYAVLTEAGLAMLEAAYPSHLDGVRRYFTDVVGAGGQALGLSMQKVHRALKA